jgi:hypothetical protein
MGIGFKPMVKLNHGPDAYARCAAAVAVTEVALHVSNSCALPSSRSSFFSPDAAPFFFKLFGSD